MEFQPFSVVCVTCGSRLRVRRQELAGTIVACPKCRSMVQLDPPPGQGTSPTSYQDGGADQPGVALGQQIVDSGALTEDSISRSESSLAGNSFAETSLPEPSLAAEGSRFAEAPPVTTDDQPEGGLPDSRAADGPAPGVRDRAFHSEKTARSRRIAFYVVVATACIISAGVLWSVISRNRSGDSVSTIASSDPSAEQADTVPQADAAQQPVVSDRDEQQPAESEIVSDPNVDPATATDGVARNMLPESDANANEAPNNQTPADVLEPPSDLIPISPLESLLPPENSPRDPSAAPADDTPPIDAIPEEFRSMIVDLDLDRPQFESMAPPPKTIDEFEIEAAADDDVDLEVMMELPEAINMRQALGLPLALKTKDPSGYPFNDLLLFITQVTGVPIEVEWLSFDIAGPRINSRAKVPSGEMNIKRFLTATCEAFGASMEVQELSIVIRPEPTRFQAAVDSLTRFDDLGAESASAVKLVDQLLGLETAAADRPSPDQVVAPQQIGPQQLAVLVCDAIRRMRGVEGKLSDGAFARWAGDFRSQVDAWPTLTGGQSGDQLIQPITFASFARQSANRNGATCFINWVDAAKNGLGPLEKSLPPGGPATTAQQAMAEVLTSWDLDVRIVDANHWWIGSAARFDRFPVVVWFDDTGKAARLQPDILAVLQGADAGDQTVGSVAIDPVSGKCIAVLPRFLLRQLPRLLESQLASQ